LRRGGTGRRKGGRKGNVGGERKPKRRKGGKGINLPNGRFKTLAALVLYGPTDMGLILMQTVFSRK